ncbi:hypothetical protein EIN_305910, partial [Entamoeba invadens IP1]
MVLAQWDCWHLDNEDLIYGRTNDNTTCGNEVSCQIIQLENDNSYIYLDSNVCGLKNLHIRPNGLQTDKLFFAISRYFQTNFIFHVTPDNVFYIVIEESVNMCDLTFVQDEKYTSNKYDVIAVSQTPEHITLLDNAKIWLAFLNVQHPYLYLDWDDTQPKNQTFKIDIRNYYNGKCSYIFSTAKNIETVNAVLPENTKLLEMCKIGKYVRYGLCRNIEDDETDAFKDCSCVVNTKREIAILDKVQMNYPDCVYNSSLYTLHISKEQLIIMFNIEKHATQWKSIVFEEREKQIELLSKEPFALFEKTIFPDVPVIIGVGLFG